MLQHICSNCLGIPIDQARYVFSEFFDSEPLIPSPCPRDSGSDGIVLNADIISSIADTFLEFYDFEPQGERLQDCLSRDFHFLSHIHNPDDKKEIIQSIFGLDSHQNFQLKHDVNYRNRIDEFHEELKSRRRYFFNKHDHFGFIFEMLDSLIGAATPASIIPELMNHDLHLYRARIGSEQDKYGNPIPFPASQMREAPSHLCKGGRINPPGFSFLYLASNEETAALEVRATPADLFTIAHVSLCNDPLMLDLRTSKILSFVDFEYYPDRHFIQLHLQKIAVFKYISEILARPVASHDPVGYIHTQIFCEYFKIKGVHGLIYDSTLCPSGFNLCLFEPTEFSEVTEPTYLARISALSARVTPTGA